MEHLEDLKIGRRRFQNPEGSQGTFGKAVYCPSQGSSVIVYAPPSIDIEKLALVFEHPGLWNASVPVHARGDFAKKWSTSVFSRSAQEEWKKTNSLEFLTELSENI